MSPVVAGIQARMGSSRLPGKSLAVLGDLPIIGWVVRRVARARHIDEVWVLTTDRPEDDALADVVVRDLPGIRLLRGSPSDVRDRYTRMIERSGATDVVRVTADCPLVDPALLDQLIDLHRAQRTDYASIRAQSHHAIAYPHGLDGEVLTRAAFSRMAELGHEPRHREHVTIAIDENPQAFRTGTLTPPPALSRPHASVCVDTADDLQRVRRVVEALGPAALDAGVEEIVAACDRVLGAAT